MITKKMFDVLKKSPYDHSGEYGGTQPPSGSTLKKHYQLKVKKSQPLALGLCTPPNEEIPSTKDIRISELAEIVHNLIWQTFLEGKKTYTPIEFQLAVQYFISEIEKHVPKNVLTQFEYFTSEDFKECIPLEITDAIYSTLHKVRSVEKSNIVTIVQNSAKSLEPINKKYIPIKKFK